MNERVVVTGIGFVTPMGDDRCQVHSAICRGKSGLAKPAVFENANLKVALAGEISDFDAHQYLGADAKLRPLNRAAQLLASSTELALAESGWTKEKREQHDIGLVAGTAYCSLGIISQFDCRAQREGPKFASAIDFANTVLNSAAGQTAIWHNLRGCNSTVSSGNVSSLDAIAYAAEMVASGKESVMLAGGIEELSEEAMLGYQSGRDHCPSGQAPCPVPFDSKRNGFVLGEAAVMFVLEQRSAAVARGAKILAELHGHGESFCLEATDLSAFVESSRHAIESALFHANVAKESIAAISLSANGNANFDLIESVAIKTCFNGTTDSIPIQAPKSATGETLGAGGAVQLGLMIESLRLGRSPGIVDLATIDPKVPLKNLNCQPTEILGTHGLVNAINPDGHCHAMVVSVGEDSQ